MDKQTEPITDESGFQRNMGYRVTPGDGEATVTLELAERHINRAGIAHGGTIMALFDAALGHASVPARLDDGFRGMVTVSVTVNFMKPVKSGTIRVEARRTGGGRKLVFSEASAFDDAGDLIATCSGTYRRFYESAEKKTPGASI